LITVEDVVAELLGGIADEFKTTQVRPLRLSDGRLRLPGAMRVEHAGRLLGVDWHPAGSTIAARVARGADGPLEPGDRLEVDGLVLEIESIESGMVTSVIASPVERKDARE
jgi:CBS domain containing-hemolysin-like protein